MSKMILFKSLIIIFSIIFSWLALSEVPLLKSFIPDFSTGSSAGRLWEPTDYLSQGSALGLDRDTFLGLSNRDRAVQFWLSVYTDYTSQQGIIHDIENLNIIYEKIDFDFINSNSSLSENQKEKARESFIEERKKNILYGLKKITANTPEEELSDFEKKIKQLLNENGRVINLNQFASMDRLRFQLGQSDRMKEAIFLSGRYLPMMETIFKNEGLPLQLTRIVFVESSFNVLARSKVGASGLWQIMPSAARGRLKVNKIVDLRNHPQKATELAAKMLRFNYEMLGSWPLAVTAYNHGPYGVKRLVERNKTRELSELIESGEGRRFGFASRNFYASFLAALEVEGKANHYFPGIRQDLPFEFIHFEPKQTLYFRDLVALFKGDRERAQLYNPHLQKAAYQNKVALDSKSYLVVPNNKKDKFLEDEVHLGSVKAMDPIPTSKLEEKDQLFSEIKSENKDHRDSKDSISNSESKKKNKAKNDKNDKNDKSDKNDREVAEVRTYKVIRGDTLYQISRQFGVSIKSILSLNELKRSRIMPGQVLLIP